MSLIELCNRYKPIVQSVPIACTFNKLAGVVFVSPADAELCSQYNWQMPITRPSSRKQTSESKAKVFKFLPARVRIPLPGYTGLTLYLSRLVYLHQEKFITNNNPSGIAIESALSFIHGRVFKTTRNPFDYTREGLALTKPTTDSLTIDKLAVEVSRLTTETTAADRDLDFVLPKGVTVSEPTDPDDLLNRLFGN